MPETEPETEEFDVIILGAGINGCGTYRDLCAQGLRCLLIEREDFCAGASAASSRLMHGGLKYLETGEFGLVRESLMERNMLLATAPHLVHPLQCVVPVRSVFGGIIGSVARFLGFKARLADRGFLITALGLTLYDIYGRSLQQMPGHHMLGRKALRRQMPQLSSSITGAGVYYEGHITHAERLGLELVLDAETLNAASRSVTHAELLGAEGGLIRYRTGAGETTARGKVIVNAGGAWIDQINRQLGITSQLMGGSRGSHLVIDNPDLLAALAGRMIYFGTTDGRVNLIYPFAGKVLVGSTDIPCADPDSAVCTNDEADYLRTAVAEVLPNLPISPDQIVQRFCGVRPLPRSDGADIGAVTRDHSIKTLTLPETNIPVLCRIGGKWTTFRGFSAQAADIVLGHLGASRKISTAGMAIGGGKGMPRTAAGRKTLAAELAAHTVLEPARVAILLSRYGTRTRDYLAALGSGQEIPLRGCPDYSEQEIRHICQTERVLTVDDILRRRTLLSLTGKSTDEVRDHISAILALVREEACRS